MTLSNLLESLKTKNISKKLHLFSALAVLLSLAMPSSAAAVDYDSEIKKLQTQNAGQQATQTVLQNTALTLEQKIANLQATIAGLTTLVQTNEAQRGELAGQIETKKAEIAHEQTVLGDSIRDLYISSDMSMIEKMASSKTLSDYVDKEQYTLSAQSKVKESLDRITELKDEQQKQKNLIDQLLKDSAGMQAQLATEKQQVSDLLAQNQSDQASVSQTIAANNGQITELQRAQAAENQRFLQQQAAPASGGSAAQLAAPAGIKAVSGYDYPWAGAPWPNNIPDPWGMYQRQCVSYTAWKVTASGRHMPYWGGRGNANQWDDNARSEGIPVDSNPRVGDVAVRNSGTYGHVMYVEAVYGDGSIDISQYNANWDGRYSEAHIYPSGLVFVHF